MYDKFVNLWTYIAIYIDLGKFFLCLVESVILSIIRIAEQRRQFVSVHLEFDVWLHTLW